MPFVGGSGSAWRTTAAAGVFAVVALAVIGGVRSTFDEDHAIALEVNTGRQAGQTEGESKERKWGFFLSSSFPKQQNSEGRTFWLGWV